MSRIVAAGNLRGWRIAPLPDDPPRPPDPKPYEFATGGLPRWQDDPGLAEAQRQHAAAVQRRQQLQSEFDAVQANVAAAERDLEAVAASPAVTDAAIAKARAKVTAAIEKAEVARLKLSGATTAVQACEATIAEAEIAAQRSVQAVLDREYRASMEAMADHLKAAARINERLVGIQRHEWSQFPEATLTAKPPVSRHLPGFSTKGGEGYGAWPDLFLDPPSSAGGSGSRLLQWLSGNGLTSKGKKG